MYDTINEANDRTTYMAHETSCLEKIQQKGYTEQFRAEGSTLYCFDNQTAYRPDDVSVINFYRFEGISDPDDMSIIYVIETTDGQKGTLIDAFGIYADAKVGVFMASVDHISKKTSRGWS